MGILKKILKGVAAAVLILLCTVLVFLATIWFKPSWYFTEKNIRRALAIADPKLVVSWDYLSLKIEPNTWHGKKIAFRTTGLCLHEGSSLNACADEVEVRFRFRIYGFFKVRLEKINRVLVNAEYIHLKPSATVENDSSEPPERLPDLRFPRIPLLTEFPATPHGAITIHVRDFEIQKKEPLKIAADVTNRKASAGTLPLVAHGRISEGRDLNLTIDLDARIRPAQGNGNISVQGLLGGIKRKLDLAFKANQTSLEATLATYPLPFPRKFRRTLVANNCQLRAELDKKKGYPAHSFLDCELLAKAKSRRAFLSTLEAKLGGEFRFSEHANQLGLDFVLNTSSDQDLISGTIQTKGRIQFAEDSFQPVAVANPGLHLDLEIPKFQLWQKALRRTAYAIPAPFHKMTGLVQLTADLQNKDFTKRADFAILLNTNLKGKNQSFVTNNRISLIINSPLSDNRTVSLSSESVLNDVALEAPPVHLESPPQILPDSRFVKSKDLAQKIEEQERENPNFDFHLALKTEKPVRIQSNLLKSPMPLDFDLALTNRTRSGFVEVQPMPIEVFAKKAEVDHVRVSFTPGSQRNDLDGELDYRTPEYLVKILLVGNTDQPRVEFESDPPLSRDQIISLLLFNRPPEELTEDEASSSSNMSQALLDGAFGLFSLFYLSSTPIQSVSYNSGTGAYSVAVSLDKKTTISYGSNFDQKQSFMVRRRLGGRWSVRTELQQDQQLDPDQRNTILTLLEWFQRF